jgi:hypothetical protein
MLHLFCARNLGHVANQCARYFRRLRFRYIGEERAKGPQELYNIVDPLQTHVYLAKFVDGLLLHPDEFIRAELVAVDDGQEQWNRIFWSRGGGLRGQPKAR